MWQLLLWLLGISVAINGAMFLLAYWRQSDKLTDVSYALTFIVLGLCLLVFGGVNTFNLIGFGLVAVWAVRIGGFLLYRVIKTGKDQRFDGIREKFWQFGKFWLGQAVTVWLLLLPLALASVHDADVSFVSYGGIVLWLAGFVVESCADFQKYRFSQTPTHKNQWIDEGLWRYSRHPNYFGEILVWVGMYVYALPHLTGGEAIAALASPACITVLLLFVSGIPPLEKLAVQRWGKQQAYQEYKRRTSLLLLLPKRRK